MQRREDAENAKFIKGDAGAALAANSFAERKSLRRWVYTLRHEIPRVRGDDDLCVFFNYVRI